MPRVIKKLYQRKKGATSKYYKRRVTSGPWPFSKLVKLRYADKCTLVTDSVTGTNEYVFRANDLYDPDYTGTGHQPRGFDQYMLMYKKFVVLGSKITARFTNLGGATNGDAMVGISVATDAATVIDIIDEMEARKSKFKILTGNNDVATTITNFYSHKTWIKSKPLTDDTVHGTASASCPNHIYFKVFARAIDTILSNTNYPTALVNIDYTAIVFDPINPSQS